MRGSTRIVVSAVIAIVACASAFAQTGGLRVQVVDGEAGEPLPGVTVVLSNTQQLVATTALVTDRDGLVLFPILRTGRGYAIEVSLPGFATQRRSDIRIASGVTATELVRLGAAIEERVEVKGSSTAVDLNKVGGTTRLTDEFLDDLPTPGRFYQDLLTLAPGVNDEDGDGNPNVHGARARDFKAEVGGVSNVDPLTGQWLSRINYDSIEELEVLTTGAGVEFGRAQGGFARILQKQGTNRFEGVFNVLYRTSKLDRDGAGNTSSVAPAPEFETLEPSVQLSGPIVKDRLWYRLSHDWIDREEPVNVLTSIEVVTRRQQIVADQLTWQVSPRNKLAFQFQSDPLQTDNIGIRTLVPSESTQRLDRDSETLSVTWTAPQSPRVLFDSTLAIQDVDQELVPNVPPGALVQQTCVRFNKFTVLRNARCVNVRTLAVSGRHPEDLLDERRRFTLRSQATVFLSGGVGSHVLKTGFSVENEQYTRDLTRRPDISWAVTIPVFAANPYGIATVRMPVPQRKVDRAEGVNWATWIEDQWRPSNGLSVTLGLRVDREELSSEGFAHFDPQAEAALFAARVAEASANGPLGTAARRSIAAGIFTSHEDPRGFQLAVADLLRINPVVVHLSDVLAHSQVWLNARRPENIEIRNTNVAPRLAVAWDPWADGKTKLSLTAGRYYDKIFLAVPLIELEPVETTMEFFAPSLSPANPPNYVFRARDDQTTLLPIATRLVDRELSTPYSDEWAVGFEREIFPETSVRLTWIERRFEDQLQDTDINTRDGLVQNPAWSALLLIGNYNTSSYRGAVLELVRRYYRNWELQASYTWSEAIGDAEDYDLLFGDDERLREQERGYLSYDQRNIFRFNATTRVAAWRLGTVLRWESGLPYSVLGATERRFVLPSFYPYSDSGFDVPALRYPTGQRNSERNPDFWTVDLLASRDFRLAGRTLLQLRAEVFNLLNDDTVRVISETDSLSIGERRFGRQYQLALKLTY